MSEHIDTCTCGSGGGVCPDHPWHAKNEPNNAILEAQNRGDWGQAFDLKVAQMFAEQEPGYEPPRDQEGNILPSEPTITDTKVVRRVLEPVVEGGDGGEDDGGSGEGDDKEEAA